MKKQISGGVLLSFFSQIITIIVGLAYTPIMIRILGQDEYGLYQLVMSVVNYLNLMNFGFNGAYIRYFVIAKKTEDDNEVANINGMFMKAFLIIATLCLVAGAVLYANIGVLGNQISEENYVIARQLLVIMIINLAISFPNSLYVAYMSANERFIYQKAIGIIINIAIPILNIPLLLLGCGSVGVVSATLFLTIIRLILNMWYCYEKLNLKINLKFFNKNIFKELMGYTFFVFLSDLVDQLNSNVDKLLLGRMTGTIAVALYSVGYNLKNYYVTVSWIVPEMYVPKANRIAIRENNNEELTEIFTKVGKINNYLMLLVLSGFFLVGRNFVLLWVGKDYAMSYYAALILMICGYVPAIQTLGVNIQNAKNMHRMRSVVYFIVACINVVASVFLIKKWGVIGTCIGTLFATILGHGLFMNYFYHKKIGLNIKLFWKEIIKWLIPVAVLTVIFKTCLCFFEVDSWLKLFCSVVIYSSCYLVMLFYIGFDKALRIKILDKIKSLLVK